MIKAVIFDLDGVLVHTDMFHYASWKHLATQEGIYFDEKINHRLRGVSRMASLEIILERASKTYSETEKLELANRKNEHYRNSLHSLSERDVAEETKAVLKTLQAQKIKLAIGSSSRNASFILAKTSLLAYFPIISDGHGLTNPKPHPEVFLKAAERLGVAPENCLVIEDAKAGVDAAKSGGFIAVGMNDAFNYEQNDYNIESLSELISIINDLNSK